METMTNAEFAFLASKGFCIGFFFGFCGYIVQAIRRAMRSPFVGGSVG